MIDLFNKKISEQKDNYWAEGFHIIMQLGLTMVGCIFFCFFVGKFIDSYLGTKGIFMVIFIFLGVIGGANTVYRQIILKMENKATDISDNGSN
jgi:ATP synthase protein I